MAKKNETKGSETKAVATKTEKAEKAEKKPRLSVRQKLTVEVGRTFNRMVRLTSRAKKREFPETVLAAFDTAEKGIRGITGALSALPADWMPPSKRAPRAEIHIAVGTKVTLRPARAEKFEGLIAADAVLEVVDVRKAILVVKLPNGLQGFLTRGDVVLAGSAAPAAKTA